MRFLAWQSCRPARGKPTPSRCLPRFTMIVPDRATFCARAQQGNLVPVYREILADRLTPVSAFEALTATRSDRDDNAYAFLLESVEGGERLGRYSFLGANPSLVFRSKGRTATIEEAGPTRTIEIAPGEDPLTLLQALLSRYQYVESPDLPRFCGGAVGFFGYDVVRFFEDLPDNNPDELDVDDACFLFTDTLLIFDHVRHRMQVLCNAHVTGDADAAYDDACARSSSWQRGYGQRRSAEASQKAARTSGTPEPPLAPKALFSRAEYEAAVERCREYILAGDAFQIVLSQRFEVEFSAPPFDVYRALRSVNPSPYMYYLDLGERKMIGTSPEILVSLIEDVVRLRPIAGTRPRGRDAREDADWRRNCWPTRRSARNTSCW